MSYRSKLSDVTFLNESDIITEFGRPVYNEGVDMNSTNDITQNFLINNRGVGSVDITKSSYDSMFETRVTSRNLNWMLTELPGLPKIKRVIFNDPATIVLWEDGTKTVVKKQKDDKKKKFDKEKGLAMAIAKKALGNQGNYFETFKKWCD